MRTSVLEFLVLLTRSQSLRCYSLGCGGGSSPLTSIIFSRRWRESPTYKFVRICVCRNGKVSTSTECRINLGNFAFTIWSIVDRIFERRTLASTHASWSFCNQSSCCWKARCIYTTSCACNANSYCDDRSCGCS
jgi:hypothetical protein